MMLDLLSSWKFRLTSACILAFLLSATLGFWVTDVMDREKNGELLTVALGQAVSYQEISVQVSQNTTGGGEPYYLDLTSPYDRGFRGRINPEEYAVFGYGWCRIVRVDENASPPLVHLRIKINR